MDRNEEPSKGFGIIAVSIGIVATLVWIATAGWGLLALAGVL